MTEHVQRSVCTYNSLGNYYFGALGCGAVAPYNSPVAPGINVVPVFKNVSYEVPNYNVLTHGSSIGYVPVSGAYASQDCVTYVDRSCATGVIGPRGTQVPAMRPSGATGSRQ